MTCSLEFEAILRHDTARADARSVVFTACAAAVLFGAVIGSFSAEPLQVLYSALKVPVLISLSTAICIPNLFVVHLVVGLHRDFPEVLRSIVTAQATVAVTLVALAPFVALFYLSSRDYELAKLFLGGVFLVASLAGQVHLARAYRELVRRDRRHALGRGLWLALYVFVTIQLAWVLRPFVGSPGMPTSFFREDSWGNAYLEILRSLRAVLGS